MQLSNVFVSLALIIASASAAPALNKRITQTIIDSVQGWENACDAANGGAQCNAIAVNASSALLAAADPCAQQDSGDIMVNVAKSLNNNQAMITAAQIFVQQARNSPNSVAVNYCQQAPQNSELNGLFQCQFQGVNEQKFANGQALGGPGTIPFGLSAPVNPLGSCPAHTSGPIPDGVQLSSLVSSPGTPAASSSSGSGASTGSSPAPSSASSPSSDPGDTSFPPPQQSGSGSSSSSPSPSSSSSSSSSSPSSSASSPGSGTSSGSSSGFQLSNGQEAQSQNSGFAQLTPSSSCTEGSQACVNGEFAQCVGGQFALTSCGTSTQCFALPLVNKAGTSITCTTQADASARIAATGATGGITGSGSGTSSAPASDSGASTSASGSSTSSGSSNNVAAPAPAAAAPSSSASSSGSGSFQLSNGQSAQQENSQFASLTASSPCTEGQQACVNGGFAQCVGGQFTITQCAGGTQCFALPLVNKPGTSIACTTESDATSRIANTGATGGITGSS